MAEMTKIGTGTWGIWHGEVFEDEDVKKNGQVVIVFDEKPAAGFSGNTYRQLNVNKDEIEFDK